MANNNTLYISGVLGLDREAQLVCGGVEAEARQALENLKHVLAAGGASLDSVVKTTILLNDMNDFRSVNQVYAECEYLMVIFRISFHVLKYLKLFLFHNYDLKCLMSLKSSKKCSS